MENIGKEIFRGNYHVTLLTLGWLIIFLFGLFNSKALTDPLPAFLAIVGFVSFSLIHDLVEKVIIIDEKILKNKCFLAFGLELEIADIICISRNSEFIFKSWKKGRIEIEYKLKDGGVGMKRIMESMYSGATIKRIITRLMEINPSIKLGRQYKDLLDGKVKVEDIKGLEIIDDNEQGS